MIFYGGIFMSARDVLSKCYEAYGGGHLKLKAAVK